MLEDACQLQDPDAFRVELRFAKVTAKFIDRQGRVMPSQDGSIEYKLVQTNCFVVIVPFKDRANNENEHLDAEDGISENIVKPEDVRVKSTDEQIVEEVSENEAMDIDRSNVEDGSKFEEEIEAIVMESNATFTNDASLWWGV